MAAGAVVAAAAAAAKRRNDDAAAIARSLEPWARVARDRGLRFSSASGAPVLEGELLGIPCRAAIELDSNKFGHTRFWARPLAVGVGPDVRVGVVPNPGGVMGFLKHHLGQDIPVGDEEFDRGFLVRATPESLASALLGPALRSYISALAVQRLGAFTWDANGAALHFPHVIDGLDATADGSAAPALALDAVIEAARWVPPPENPFR